MESLNREAGAFSSWIMAPLGEDGRPAGDRRVLCDDEILELARPPIVGSWCISGSEAWLKRTERLRQVQAKNATYAGGWRPENILWRVWDALYNTPGRQKPLAPKPGAWSGSRFDRALDTVLNWCDEQEERDRLPPAAPAAAAEAVAATPNGTHQTSAPDSAAPAPRLVIDLASSTVTLDGSRRDNIGPSALRALWAYQQAAARYGEATPIPPRRS
jgi:hypothetical protein